MLVIVDTPREEPEPPQTPFAPQASSHVEIEPGSSSGFPKSFAGLADKATEELFSSSKASPALGEEPQELIDNLTHL